VTVYVHVERLILDGIALHAGYAERLRAAVAGELERLVAEGGLGPGGARSAAVPSARASDIPLAGDPAALGGSVGRAVYRAVAP